MTPEEEQVLSETFEAATKRIEDLERQLSAKSEECERLKDAIKSRNIIQAEDKAEIESLRKQLEYKDKLMKENMMIAFTAGHCMVPGDVRFEEWYRENFVNT